MGNYRESMSKRSCLFNAIGWTVIFAMNLYNLASSWSRESLSEEKSIFVLAAILLAALAVHWYRFLCYDKKINTNQEEQNNE